MTGEGRCICLVSCAGKCASEVTFPFGAAAWASIKRRAAADGVGEALELGVVERRNVLG